MCIAVTGIIMVEKLFVHKDQLDVTTVPNLDPNLEFFPSIVMSSSYRLYTLELFIAHL